MSVSIKLHFDGIFQLLKRRRRVKANARLPKTVNATTVLSYYRNSFTVSSLFLVTCENGQILLRKCHFQFNEYLSIKL